MENLIGQLVIYDKLIYRVTMYNEQTQQYTLSRKVSDYETNHVTIKYNELIKLEKV